jgi:hypothetical protein
LSAWLIDQSVSFDRSLSKPTALTHLRYNMQTPFLTAPPMRLLLLISLLCLGSQTHAGDIKLKNYEIGMPFVQLKTKTRCQPDGDGRRTCYIGSPNLTVGGEAITGIMIKFDTSGRADQIMMRYKSVSHDAIKAAITGKYKGVVCQQSDVTTRMGVKFVNESCLLTTTTELLSFSRYGSNVDDGTIILASAKRIADHSAKAEAKASDI